MDHEWGDGLAVGGQDLLIPARTVMWCSFYYCSFMISCANCAVCIA